MRHDFFSVAPRCASMEPSSVEDGNMGVIATHSEIQSASMEPSSVEDGNHRCTGLRPGRGALQWSRPQLRTETQSAQSPLMTEERASMEPSSVEDGNHSDSHNTATKRVASMEPSSVEDGNDNCGSRFPATANRFNGAVLS